MPGYTKLARRDIDRAPDRATASKFFRARLKHAVGDKPTGVQWALIRSLTPLFFWLEDRRLEFEASGELHPDYAKMQGQFQTGLARLMATAKDKPSAPGGIDLESILA